MAPAELVLAYLLTGYGVGLAECRRQGPTVRPLDLLVLFPVFWPVHLLVVARTGPAPAEDEDELAPAELAEPARCGDCWCCQCHRCMALAPESRAAMVNTSHLHGLLGHAGYGPQAMR
jgi:hypothetical protein